jgi:transposase
LTPKQTKALWKREEMLKKRQAEIEAGTLNPDSPYFDDRHIPEDPETKDAKDAWKQLIAVARVKFPEHLAAKYQLRPKQRLVAIARTLGWEVKKIAKASDIHERTIYRWLEQPDVQAFMEAFDFQQGSADHKKLLDREIFSSIETLKELRDDSSTPASVRQSISTWFFEQKYGKSKETREVRGYNIKDVTKELMKHKPKDLFRVTTEQGEEENDDSLH